MGRWPTRDDLGAAAGSVSGLLLVSPDGTTAVPLGPDDHARTARALRAAGVGERDRVVVALAEPAGSLWAAAAAEVAEAGAAVGPRGRMRLHHALTALRATTLVATPTGAMDFLARLHLEFLLDPLDLGLRTIVLTGEIASKRTMGHLAHEFGARVTEVLASPFGGAALAWRAAEQDPLTPLADDLLALASPAEDVLIESGPAELVLTTPDAVLRTGLVALAPGAFPAHTVGEHVLVRGLWLALPRLEKALSRIDGVTGWELAVSRQGTLDTAALTVTFGRESLIGNPMWKARIEESVRALTPISVAVEIAPKVSEAPAPGTVNDLRGHHLGRDRSLIT
ncbi:hypothetical protein AB0K18_42135 [Nonomuraea sp. NPDC049421]|uniref:hypothetical protein n=1 Tax=Nonomuraea sp. NPDC049421 TaxID=3155275 RepID=UPI0034463917